MQRRCDEGSLCAWLKSHNRGLRLLVALACVLMLSLFFHFREIKLDRLVLNHRAERSVVAEVDFAFPDYETTILMKQEAMRDIGLIYQIDDRHIRQVREKLDESLIKSRAWREAAPSTPFDEMYKAADELEELLLEARFTDPRTLKRLTTVGTVGNTYYEWTYVTFELGRMPLSDEVWAQIGQQLRDTNRFRTETIDYVMQPFRGQEWELIEDLALEHALKAKVSRSVSDASTEVAAGTRLVDQGERVTSRHLTMMQALRAALTDGRELDHPLGMIGSALLAMIFVTIGALYFRISQLEFSRSLRQISLFVTIVAMGLLFAKLAELAQVRGNAEFFEWMRYPIIAPFATLLICVLLSQRT
ncbi:MAG: uncharacterized protein RL235_206, partial [Chlamydiota bacterium]